MRFSALRDCTRNNLKTDGARCHMFFQQTKRPPLGSYERFDLDPKPSEQML
jgi:hypothetical protein